MILEVFFWILLALCALGFFAPDTVTYTRGRGIVILLLIAILGYWHQSPFGK
jgi:hypothetical protein